MWSHQRPGHEVLLIEQNAMMARDANYCYIMRRQDRDGARQELLADDDSRSSTRAHIAEGRSRNGATSDVKLTARSDGLMNAQPGGLSPLLEVHGITLRFGGVPAINTSLSTPPTMCVIGPKGSARLDLHTSPGVLPQEASSGSRVHR